MDVVVMIAQLISGLSILVFIHEMGHFMAAKAFKIKVDKFYIFFDAWGYKLFSFKRGDTEYGVGWIPLGGYVKIAGMIDESMDKEAMSKDPQPWEFRSKPAWQRFIVMIGGIVMNLALGVLIYSLSLLFLAEKYIPVNQMTSGIYAYDFAQEIGLKTGDKVIAINGDEIKRYKDIVSPKMLLGESITVIRDNEQVEIVIPEGFLKEFASRGRRAFVDLANHEFIVNEVVEKSPADSAGLKVGDKITKVNNDQIKVFGDFKQSVFDNKGKKVKIEVDRAGQTVVLDGRVRSDGTL
ncbi:MAG: RIP metalloprotease RseP, partial [Bacteroidetes bacterium]|nr:RIP metalloprotease RseP [Bacteroidota bacterium]